MVFMALSLPKTGKKLKRKAQFFLISEKSSFDHGRKMRVPKGPTLRLTPLLQVRQGTTFTGLCTRSLRSHQPMANAVVSKAGKEASKGITAAKIGGAASVVGTVGGCVTELVEVNKRIGEIDDKLAREKARIDSNFDNASWLVVFLNRLHGPSKAAQRRTHSCA
jgi:hypothetical protein